MCRSKVEVHMGAAIPGHVHGPSFSSRDGQKVRPSEYAEPRDLGPRAEETHRHVAFSAIEVWRGVSKLVSRYEYCCWCCRMNV